MDERILFEMLEEAGCKNSGECAKFLVANDVIVREHARWRIESDDEEPNPMFKLVVCSACGSKAGETYNYCPNCGARMDGECNG